MPLTPKGGKFCEGEKLLCYHGPLLYEAKCIKIKKENGNFMYLVHYQGWNKNWYVLKHSSKKSRPHLDVERGWRRANEHFP
jgi:hypothetical protein